MSFTKIQNTDLTNVGVIGLPDVPALSTARMQEKFEETTRSVVIPKHNELIDELEAPTGASNIGTTNGTVQTDIDGKEGKINRTSLKYAVDPTDTMVVVDTNGDTQRIAAPDVIDSIVKTIPIATQTSAGKMSAPQVIQLDQATTDITQAQNDINVLKTQAHTHSNKPILDDISDNNGKLEYKGQVIGGGDSYKTIKIGGTNLVASGSDTVEFVAGSNVSMTANPTTKQVVINATGGGGGTSTGDMLKADFVLPGGSGQVLSAKDSDHAVLADKATKADEATKALQVGNATTSVLEDLSDISGKLAYKGVPVSQGGGGGTANGGSLLHIFTNDFAGYQVKVTSKDPYTSDVDAQTAFFDATGHASFNLALTKDVEAEVTDGSTVYKVNIPMENYKIYKAEINRFVAYIDVTVPSGATVTARSGSFVFSATSVNNVAHVTIGEKGSYTVTADINGVTTEDSVSGLVITTSGQTLTATLQFAEVEINYTGTLIATVTKGSFSYAINDNSGQNTFYVPGNGKYDIAGTLDGNAITSEVTVSGYAKGSVTISASSFYEDWLTLGGFSTTTYPTLADLLTEDSQGENEKAIRKLMTLHDCADKLLEWYNDNPSDFPLNEFTSSRIAMKWIGLRDYVCDKLMAIEDIYNAMMSSTHWEYILKDKVPIMTSNSAPYGEANAYSKYGSDEAWKAFNGDSSNQWSPANNPTASYPQWIQYKFENPICVKKFSARGRTDGNAKLNFVIQASNDGIDFSRELYKVSSGQTFNTTSDNIENDDYFMYYRVTAYDVIGFAELQFYGRALNVSVPKMNTDNYTPWGEAFSSSNQPDYKAFNVFDGNDSTPWNADIAESITAYVGYDFGKKVFAKLIECYVASNDQKVSIEASNDNFVSEKITIVDEFALAGGSRVRKETTNTEAYRYYRAKVTKVQGTTPWLHTLQFFGVDYSEREFEPSATMRYIYDNGVELEQVTKTATSVLANIDINTTDKLLRATVGSHATTSDKIKCGSGSATLTSDMMPNNCYLDISSISGTQEVGFSQVADTTDISCWVE